MALVGWEGSFKEGPHGPVVADDGLVLLLQTEVEGAPSLLHEGGTNEDVSKTIEECIHVGEVIHVVDEVTDHVGGASSDLSQDRVGHVRELVILGPSHYPDVLFECFIVALSVRTFTCVGGEVESEPGSGSVRRCSIRWCGYSRSSLHVGDESILILDLRVLVLYLHLEVL